MSETTSPHRVLYLVVGRDGSPLPSGIDGRERLASLPDNTEIFELTEANAREALQKIFAADTVAVWGRI